jgi:hypothetical protein
MIMMKMMLMFKMILKSMLMLKMILKSMLMLMGEKELSRSRLSVIDAKWVLEITSVIPRLQSK